jgi:hypothetical protein
MATAEAKVTLRSRTCGWGLGNYPSDYKTRQPDSNAISQPRWRKRWAAAVSAAAAVEGGDEMGRRVRRTNPSHTSLLRREPISFRYQLGARDYHRALALVSCSHAVAGVMGSYEICGLCGSAGLMLLRSGAGGPTW